MTGIIQIQRLHRVTVVVRDLAAATRRYAEALGGESPFREFEAVRHEGVCSIRLATVDFDEAARIHSQLAERGIPLAEAMTVDDVEHRLFFDTRKALGGFLVEIVVPLSGDEIEVSERWDHSESITGADGVEPLDVQGVSHFGVVVDDVMETLAEYNTAPVVGGYTVEAVFVDPKKNAPPTQPTTYAVDFGSKATTGIRG